MKRTIGKRLLGLLLALCLLSLLPVVAMAAETGTRVYANMEHLWPAEKYDYAMWTWLGAGSGSWVMPDTTQEVPGYVAFTVPEGNDMVIFAAIRKGTAIDWSYRDYQTVDMTAPTDGAVYFTLEKIGKEGAWATGQWKTAPCQHDWVTKENEGCNTGGVQVTDCTKCKLSYTVAVPAESHSPDASGLCTKCGQQMEVRITDVYGRVTYSASFWSALEESIHNTGSTMTLLRDVTTGEGVSSGYSSLLGNRVTLDLNGHTWTVANGATYRLGIQYEGTIKGPGQIVTTGCAMDVEVGSYDRLTLQNAQTGSTVAIRNIGVTEITESTVGGQVSMSYNSTLRFNSGKIHYIQRDGSTAQVILPEGKALVNNDGYYEFLDSTQIGFDVTLTDAPLVITQEPEDVTMEYGEDRILSVTCSPAEGASYQWRDSSTQLPDETGNTLALNTLSPGEHSISCRILYRHTHDGIEDTYMVSTRTATVVIKECPHAEIVNGQCQLCQAVFEASVTAGNTTKYFETFTAAWSAALENRGSVLALLKDCTLNDYAEADWGDITLELQGHSLNTGDYFLYFRTGLLTLRDSSAAQTGRIYTTINSGNSIYLGSATLMMESGTVERVEVADYGGLQTVEGKRLYNPVTGILYDNLPEDTSYEKVTVVDDPIYPTTLPGETVTIIKGEDLAVDLGIPGGDGELRCDFFWILEGNEQNLRSAGDTVYLGWLPADNHVVQCGVEYYYKDASGAEHKLTDIYYFYVDVLDAFTVTWMNGENQLKQVENVASGTSVAELTQTYITEPPIQTGDTASIYVFAGWEGPDTVTGDTVLQAKFHHYKEFRYVGPTATTKPQKGYYCEETGDELYRDIDATGLLRLPDNYLYYLNDQGFGVAGLVRTEDAQGHVHYYYFQPHNYAAFQAEGDSTRCQVTQCNGLELIPALYEFDANGVIKHFEDTSIQGFYSEPVSGNTYDCVDGVIQPRGLFARDGQLYYARTSNGALVTDRTYYVTVTNGLIQPGLYRFDPQGRMLPDGFREEDGKLYYYKGGRICTDGLIQVDGAYYYARTSTGEIIRNRAYYITVTNGLPLKAGKYSFDEAGKLLVPENVKNGMVEENGGLYYYVDGRIAYAGLIQIGEDYYYVRTSTGEVICGRTYWVTATNGLLEQGLYSFDETGKLIEN